MPRKADLKEVDRIARAFEMDREDRRGFGKFLEDPKDAGDRSTKNDRGDFTTDELRQKARDYLGIADEW